MKRDRRRIQRSKGELVFDGFNRLIMWFVIIVIVYPFLNIIAVSFSSAYYAQTGQVTFYPKDFTLSAYEYVFQDPQVFTGFRNSVIYAIGSVIVTLTFTSLIGYPLIYPQFKLRKFVTVVLAITMFFSGGMIPMYLLMRDLKLMDTLWVMILPGSVSAYNVFMFRTFFNNIPGDLRESAIIDGAGEWTVLLRIILPLSKPLLATFTLFTAVGSWNSWFNALLFLTDSKRYPLQLILRNYIFTIDASAMQARAGTTGAASLISQMRTDPTSVRMAMVLVTIVPIMLIYPSLQKYFAKGVMIGAIKG